MVDIKIQSKASPNRHRFNDRFIKTVRPGPKRTLYWDTVQHGLVLSVEPTGHKSYKLIYSMRGRPRWFTIGSAQRIGLKEARQIAREKAAEVGRGIDIQAERMSEVLKGLKAECQLHDDLSPPCWLGEDSLGSQFGLQGSDEKHRRWRDVQLGH